MLFESITNTLQLNKVKKYCKRNKDYEDLNAVQCRNLFWATVRHL